MTRTELFEVALMALHSGKTLLYPTDTIWGIGCDAGNANAVEKIYAIKQRDHNKSMLVLAQQQMLSEKAPQQALALLHDERPTTVIMPAHWLSSPLADNVVATDGTIGVRLPNMEFCQQLLQSFGRPIVSTSANTSGELSPNCYEAISNILKERIDYCLPDDPWFHHPPTGSSRIVKLTEDGTPITLRP